MNRFVFDPIMPPPLIALLGFCFFGITLWVYIHAGARLTKSRQVILLILRLFGALSIIVILLQPSRRNETEERRQAKVLLVGIDASKSMNQHDAGSVSRLDAAKKTIRDASLLHPNREVGVRFFAFGEDAIPTGTESIATLQADARETRTHRAVVTMLQSLRPDEASAGLVLLSDGHDLGNTSAAKTATAARLLRTKIFTVPFGDRGLVRDASVSMTNFEPYSYVNQKARLTANVRLIGCEHEEVTVQLLRNNQLVKTMRLNPGAQREAPVEFAVTEPQTGQIEYEIRVQPLSRELDQGNNSALTYLNVIDQRIRILLLEGAPYWDTSFLRRSLAANDKIELDAAMQYTGKKARLIRSGDQKGELQMPASQEDFNLYDIIILGKSVDRLMDGKLVGALQSFVSNRGGVLIYSRGPAFDNPTPATKELDSAEWISTSTDRVRLNVAREGRSLSPFQILLEHPGGPEALPVLLAAHQIADKKTLSTMLAESQPGTGGPALPGMIYRRVGQGQILSVAVEGLWKWSFNPKSTGRNNVFDRFWDQLTLWLVANGDFQPSRPFSFRTSSANLLLGSPVHLRLNARDPSGAPHQVPVTIFQNEKQVARIGLTASDAANPGRLIAEYLPETPGRYRAVARLPDGSSEELKWMVFEENLEEKEVATDTAYLRELAEGSGGRILTPDDLQAWVEKLEKPEATPSPKVQLTSIWDVKWFFYGICTALGLDWYLRRKWGLC